MGGKFFEMVTTIALGIVGVAFLALVVSKKSNTTGVIQASGSAFGNSLAVAEAPVTGANTPIDLSYPNPGLGFTGFSPNIGGNFGF